MVFYDKPLWRPPSEANSLILQATIGCSHNRCLFCYMYRGKRFRVRKWEDLKRDIDQSSRLLPDTRRVFLADGDAFVLSRERLEQILDYLNESFPRLNRVSCYASPDNLIKKSVKGMKRLRDRKLTIIYYGIETGDADLLRKIDKGAGPEEIEEGCGKAASAGIKLSATVILGLAGKKGSLRHAEETSTLVSRINPRYLSVLTLMLGQHSSQYERQMGDGFEFNSPVDDIRELRTLIGGLDVDRCIFRSNHVSNYLSLKGVLKKNKKELIETIDCALENPQIYLRNEPMRGL
ncbi:MAG: radical SAM protein [Candidatus Krumholzibacteriota bacterium]|nr:radical SAM protein [Candidatus Krumholzibacteriota bacterium]